MRFIVGLIITLLTVFPVSAQELLWEQTSGPYGGRVRKLFATPDGTLYVSMDSSSGVFCSKDSGNSWTKINKGLENSLVNSFAILGATLFVGTADTGIFCLDYDGNSWINVNNGLTNKIVTSLAVLDTTLIAGTWRDGASWMDIFRSEDGGNSWVKTGLAISYIRSFVVIGTTLFAGGDSGIYRSDDRGNTWNAVNSVNTESTEPWTTSLVAADTTLFAGTSYYGVFRSKDIGNTWTQVNTGLMNKQVWSLAVLGTMLYAGTRGGLFRASISK